MFNEQYFKYSTKNAHKPKPEIKKKPQYQDIMYYNFTNYFDALYIEYIDYQNMAFVYRTHKQNIDPRAKTPGPGAYDSLKQTKFTNSAVGFFDRASRKLWKASTTPGPGEYNVQNQPPAVDGQTILYGTIQSAFCLTDAFIKKPNGCSSNFKSTSKRMTMNESKTPGPGQYQVAESQYKQFYRSCSSSQKPTKLTKYLYQQAKKHQRTFDDMFSTQANKSDHYVNVQFEKSNLDKQNNLQNLATNKKQEPKNNYKSIFNSKVQRQFSSRPQTSNGVGPGSYNVADSYNALDKKTINYRSQQFINANEPKCLQAGEGQKQKIGPGYYKVQTSSFKRPKTSQSRGIPCFGSKQTRFTNVKIETAAKGTPPGPQTYFNDNKKIRHEQEQKAQKMKKKNVPFSSSTPNSHQFIQLCGSTSQTQVSPFSYHPRNDFIELLKKNFGKSSVGNFGSTVERFKEKSANENKDLVSTATNDMTINCSNNESYDRRPKSNYQFRNLRSFKKFTQSWRHRQRIQSQAPKPVCYDTNYRTISSKFSKKQQMEAPFMTASERFFTKTVDFQQQIVEAIQKQQSKAIKITGNRDSNFQKPKICKGKPTNQSVIGKYLETTKKFKEIQRLEQENKEQPVIGPQTYNPEPIPKKKSYNILFKQ